MDRAQFEKIGEEFAAQFMGFDDKGRLCPGLIDGGDGVPVHLAGRSSSFACAHDYAARQYPGYQPGEDALLVGYAIAAKENYHEVYPDQTLLTFPLLFQGVKVYYRHMGVVRALGG